MGGKPQVTGGMRPHWFSRAYFARLFARRPAQLAAAAVFFVVVCVLIYVFASGTESQTLNLGSGNAQGTTLNAGGQVQLSPSSSLKPPELGIVDERSLAGPAYRSIINMSVVDVTWAELQPNSTDDPIPTDASVNPIEERLSEAQSYNSTHPTAPQMGIKIRLFAGIDAPAWAKSLGGCTPFYIQDLTNGGSPGPNNSGTVGCWWTPAYEQAYAHLQQLLAARYDSNPLIRDITISGCMTVYAEPLFRQIGDQTSLNDMLGAGYSTSADEQCEMDQIDANKVWVHTRSSLAFNPYQTASYVGTQPTGTVDEAFTEQLMDYCRATLGNRCILENNSIRSNSKFPDPDYASMYAKMKMLGAPMSFQTATTRDVGDWAATMQWAIAEGATAVEVNGDGSAYSATQLASFDSQLEQNPYQ